MAQGYLLWRSILLGGGKKTWMSGELPSLTFDTRKSSFVELEGTAGKSRTKKLDFLPPKVEGREFPADPGLPVLPREN